MDRADELARRRAVVVAGHRGDSETAVSALTDPAPAVRAAAVGAAHRCGVIEVHHLDRALADPARDVRLRALDVVATFPGDERPRLVPLLEDDDHLVAERAAWACGERSPVEPGAVVALGAMTTDHAHRLCREAAVAALGAIGDAAGLPAILAATRDIATIRRRAVLALAPFGGDAVEQALEAALEDRDWQTRQAAEDLLGVERRN